MIQNTLPTGWAQTEIRQVSSLLRGVSYKKEDSSKSPKDEFLPVLRSNNIQSSLVFEDLVYVAKKNIKEDQLIKSGDIVLAMSSGSKHLVGKTAQAKEDLAMSFGAFCGLIRSHPFLNAQYLGYFFQSPFYRKKISSLSKGVNINNLRRDYIEELVFPLPPLNEQHRIVEKIEELFSKLDSAVTELKNVKAQLKRYRQSVLKSAFEGRLTEEFRKANNYPNWQSLTLKELGIIKRGKSKHRPRNHPKLYGGIYPFIQTGDIRAANGKVIKEYTQTYSEEGLKQSKLWKKGTLCITIAANIGDTAILGFDACFPDSVVGFLPYKELSTSEFINYYFIYFKQNIENLAPATAQKNINVSILEKIEIHTPSVIEQQKIVEEIETRFSVADKIEEEIDRNLKKTEQLRQSILKQAFQGKLVPQDPNDEPAEELLKRIKAEKSKEKNK